MPQVRARYGVAEGELLVACVGRLKARKGMIELVQAVADVRRRHANVRAVIAGSVSSASRDYASSLSAAISALGLGDVVTVDEHVDVTEVPVLIAAADIVAQPSHEEGLGLAALEAMAAGKPTIVTDVVGFREILTSPDISAVVAAHDVAALSGALATLVGDPDRRTRLGARGREHVQRNFSLDTMISRIEAELAGLSGSRKAEVS